MEDLRTSDLESNDNDCAEEDLSNTSTILLQETVIYPLSRENKALDLHNKTSSDTRFFPLKKQDIEQTDCAKYLDKLAQSAAGLSEIERTALKDIQRALVGGDYNKLSKVVNGFAENPSLLKGIAGALEKNLNDAGITVSFEEQPTAIVEAGKGRLTFGLRTPNGDVKMSVNTVPTTERGDDNEIGELFGKLLVKKLIPQIPPTSRRMPPR